MYPVFDCCCELFGHTLGRAYSTASVLGQCPLTHLSLQGRGQLAIRYDPVGDTLYTVFVMCKKSPII